MTFERMADRADGLAHRLIRRAAQRAPDALSERLEEEWLADLAEHRGRLSRLRFAFGCCWATGVIVRDRGLAILPATSSVRGGQAFGYSQKTSAPVWRRSSAFVLVACLHVAVFYALAIGLSPQIGKTKPSIFETREIPSPRHDQFPPLPPPTISKPRIQAEIPEIPATAEPDLSTVIVALPPEPPHPESLGSEPPMVDRVQVSRLQGGPGVGFPSPDDFYPSISIHMGEKGAATVKVCVDGKGRLTSEPTISQSTGSSRLDGGALRLAKAGSGHYRATTENGQPVDSCYPLRIRFDLKN